MSNKSEIDIMHFDVKEIISNKMPNKKIPSFLIKYIKKIVHQDELNQFFIDTKGKKNLEFISDAIYNLLNVTVEFEGEKNLPPSDDNPKIFVSNHPLGGLDSLIIGMMLGKHYDGKVKFYANDILMYLTPLNEMFLPINKLGGQAKENIKLINEFYRSDNHLITFPAGTCSRKISGKVQDKQWQKNFVSKAIEYKRDVVPIFFDGKNSNFFYNFSNIRTKLHLPNIEMLYLINEMFKQKGNHFRVKIGTPIPYSTFTRDKKPIEWAALVREKVYQL